jgi:hypothetical protein
MTILVVFWKLQIMLFKIAVALSHYWNPKLGWVRPSTLWGALEPPERLRLGNTFCSITAPVQTEISQHPLRQGSHRYPLRALRVQKTNILPVSPGPFSEGHRVGPGESQIDFTGEGDGQAHVGYFHQTTKSCLAIWKEERRGNEVTELIASPPLRTALI